jgi:hypothetical protein
MFSIKKINQIYNKIYNETENVHWTDRLFANPYLRRVRYNRKDRLTEQQWQNLFDVCSIIEVNFDRLDMRRYHGHNQCGTTHCLAGWAVAYEMNDPDFRYYAEDENRYIQILEKYGLALWSESPQIAEAILSKFIEPFFYLYQSNAETVVFREFILPVIEEGKKDGLFVSPHAVDFIASTNNKHD